MNKHRGSTGFNAWGGLRLRANPGGGEGHPSAASRYLKHGRHMHRPRQCVPRASVGGEAVTTTSAGFSKETCIALTVRARLPRSEDLR